MLKNKKTGEVFDPKDWEVVPVVPSWEDIHAKVAEWKKTKSIHTAGEVMEMLVEKFEVE